MSKELLLNLEDQLSEQTETELCDVAAEKMSINQEGEWDISLFDELDSLGDADDLLEALENSDYMSSAADMNLDFDLPAWSCELWGYNASTCTDGDIPTDVVSPAHTIISASSPTSTEAHSPCSLFDEALSPLSAQSQPSPVSVCSDSSSSFEPAPREKKPGRRTNQIKVKSVPKPIHLSPKVSIRPKPLITLPLSQTTAPLHTKTIFLQPVQAAIVPMVKAAPITIQPAPPAGQPTLLSQPTQVLQLQAPQVVPAGSRVLTMPSMAQDRPKTLSASVANPAVSSPVVGIPLCNSPSDEDSSVSRRQQRMIKNRESASLSRKKKKEYLLTLQAHLKVALSENEKLKNENGTLKKQLEGLMNENTILKATAPKRRAVCLMVILVFIAVNIAPLSLFERDVNSRFVADPSPGSRHLLGFDNSMEDSLHDALSSYTDNQVEHSNSVSEEKALMVVKGDPLFKAPPAIPPCQPPVNRTKCIKMTSELRGWVHRHEAERTKSQRPHARARTLTKPPKKAEVAQIMTVQYTDSSNKLASNELQVYYAPHRTYSSFFDEIHRRGDTFYVISFRRDHLLLPATNHNRGSRPKMSVVLPAMNINESVIKDKEFEVMMQIDCEVMDTRILHIRSSSVPPILRVNETDAETFYPSAPTNSHASPVGVLMGSA